MARRRKRQDYRARVSNSSRLDPSRSVSSIPFSPQAHRNRMHTIAHLQQVTVFRSGTELSPIHSSFFYLEPPSTTAMLHGHRGDTNIHKLLSIMEVRLGQAASELCAHGGSRQPIFRGYAPWLRPRVSPSLLDLVLETLQARTIRTIRGSSPCVFFSQRYPQGLFHYVARERISDNRCRK